MARGARHTESACPGAGATAGCRPRPASVRLVAAVPGGPPQARSGVPLGRNPVTVNSACPSDVTAVRPGLGPVTGAPEADSAGTAVSSAGTHTVPATVTAVRGPGGQPPPPGGRAAHLTSERRRQWRHDRPRRCRSGARHGGSRPRRARAETAAAVGPRATRLTASYAGQPCCDGLQTLRFVPATESTALLPAGCPRRARTSVCRKSRGRRLVSHPSGSANPPPRHLSTAQDERKSHAAD